MKSLFLGIAGLLCSGAVCASAQNYAVHWHNETADTILITERLLEASRTNLKSPSARVAWFGRQFEGTPYVAHTLEIVPEAVVVNFDGLDCTTFVETALALAYTAGERRLGWQDFVYNLRRLRYRGGEVNGYASRLHYICDWVMDNVHRGNIVDITPQLDKVKYAVRTIDFMSSHRDAYKQLADSAEFARIRAVEDGYRNHRFPYITAGDLLSKANEGKLREGDIIAFVGKNKDLDVTHMGMLVRGDDGQWHALHASSTNGRVEVSAKPLRDFVRLNPSWLGMRILRLKE